MVSASAVSATVTAVAAMCTTSVMPTLGMVRLYGVDKPVTLAEPIVYQIPCPTQSPEPAAAPLEDRSNKLYNSSGPLPSFGGADTPDRQIYHSDYRDSFSSSTFPIIYALAATTITSYVLVIVLLIVPRSFVDGGMVYLGRRSSFTSGGSVGGASIGGRPLLQKIAALTVAVSLTIATVDTMKSVQQQYIWSIQNARLTQKEVMGSMELRVIRIISSTFLWLAQAQTLIRLFPRHRERVIIKWVAFLLISLDVIFSALNSFAYPEYDLLIEARPRNFVHPVPAMSYVFQLSLGLLYAAWVMYYALMKRRYAFYHPLMKNMSLVAFISVLSITIPIVFFILDVSQPKFTGWGDYVRWVGAAAASVVVWEWVERIEALEREEKKDGVLGREVFDADDMLQVNASDFPWLRRRRSKKGGGKDGGDDLEDQQTAAANGWAVVPTPAQRLGGQNGSALPAQTQTTTQRTMGDILRPPLWPSRPAPAVTPVSRTDTPSVASTVYAVRYQAGSEATGTPDPLPMHQNTMDFVRQYNISRGPGDDGHQHQTETAAAAATTTIVTTRMQNGQATQAVSGQQSGDDNTQDPEMSMVRPPQTQGRWQSLTAANPFFRGSTDDRPPAEVIGHVPPNPQEQQPPRSTREGAGRWDVRNRFEEFAANRADRLREKFRPLTKTDDLPVTVIPAPPRDGAALQQVLEEEEDAAHQARLENQDQYRQLSSAESSGDTSDGFSRIDRADASVGRSNSVRSRTQPIPPNNPPLWPGVSRRLFTYDEDDEDFYDEESITEDGVSVMSGEERLSSSRNIGG